MNTKNKMDDTIRGKIIADPEAILEDHGIMRALVKANELAMGENIIDLRGIAMERLEDRMERLQDMHRSVVSAAYDNLAGTNQIHRAILSLLETTLFEDCLHRLQHDIASIMRVDTTKLVLESKSISGDFNTHNIQDILLISPSGFCDQYIRQGRSFSHRQVTLRHCQPTAAPLYDNSLDIASEACLRLDLGENNMPGMLLMGSRDPDHFAPKHGTDLLAFYTDVLERHLRRWLTS